MNRILLVAVAAVVAVGAGLFAYSRLQADDAMDQAALLAVINAELENTAWQAESVTFAGDREERQRGDERLIVHAITVTARATRPLYRQSERVDDIFFVNQTVEVGDSFELVGQAALFIGPGTREKDFHLTNTDDMLMSGRNLSAFTQHGNVALVEGSEEAIAARAEIEQARAEAEAAERAEAERLSALYGGDWISLSRCGNIDFEYRVSLEPAEDQGRFTGEVSYRPIYPSPPFELGSYTANARIDTRRDRLVIEHGGWTERPDGNRAVSITLAAEGGEDGAPVELIGESANMLGAMARGNCSHRLQRPDDFEAEREAVMAPVRALIERMEEGVWIEGSQTGPERDGRTEWPVRLRVNEITENYVVAVAELRAFHQNSRRVLGDVEYPFAVFLTHGIENARIEWGRRPRPRGGDMRNLYTRSNFCSALRISLDAETGVVSGSNNDRQGCIDELRLPLVP